MKETLRVILLILLILSFVGVTAAQFLLSLPIVPVFSLYLFIIFCVQALGRASIAFMLTGFATLFGVYGFSRLPQSEILSIPILILVLWGGHFLLYIHQEKDEQRARQESRRKEQMVKDIKNLRSESAFYDFKKGELLKRATQRKQLSHAVKELGSLLDPDKIHEKLIEVASHLFPGRQINVAYGGRPDPVEQFVRQKRQPVLVPNEMFKGEPLMAAPILVEGSVAGVLKIGEDGGALFAREDLRLLDMLAGLASLALDNSFLFARVHETALKDGLTGILTHRAFQDVLENAILEASRYQQPLSLIMVDIDHFKSVNDRYGHQVGDQILQGVVHVLSRHVRDVDVMARYGGEEFVMLLYQMPLEEACRLAEGIRADLEAQRFDTGSQMIQVTASFGVASFPTEATSSQQIVRLADQRLYAAKQAGRNQVKGRAA